MLYLGKIRSGRRLLPMRGRNVDVVSAAAAVQQDPGSVLGGGFLFRKLKVAEKKLGNNVSSLCSYLGSDISWSSPAFALGAWLLGGLT